MQLLKTENEKYLAFSRWLDNPKNISFGDFIPVYLEAERLRTEQWEREKDQRKLKEAREREERNAKAMEAVERRLGGGHYF